MYRSIAIGIILAVSVTLSTAMGQGQVYLFGQLASSTSNVKLPEIAKISTQNNTITFKTAKKSSIYVRTVLCNSQSRIHISSVTNENAPRHLSAAITSGNIPNGTTLKLTVNYPNNHFKGNPGEIRSEIPLNNRTSKKVISEIGTCYSGNGSDDGYTLEFTYILPSSTNVKTDSKAIAVTLTLSSEV